MDSTPGIRKELDKLGEEKRSLPDRTRKAAIKAKGAGIPVAEIAYRLGTTTTTIYTWLKDLPDSPLDVDA